MQDALSQITDSHTTALIDQLQKECGQNVQMTPPRTDTFHTVIPGFVSLLVLL